MSVDQDQFAATMTAQIAAVNAVIATLGTLENDSPTVLSTLVAAVQNARVPYDQAIAAFEADIDQTSVGGVIALGNQAVPAPRTNLILQSNTFSDPLWVPFHTTVTPNSGMSPDGTNDAWLWQRAITGTAYTGQTAARPASALPYTFSMYAKAGTGNFLMLYMSDSVGFNNVRATFNLATGVISLAPHLTGAVTNVSATIVPAANGFYRCSITATMTVDASLRCFFSGNSVNGELEQTDIILSTILVYGAQVEQSTAPTAYILTTTAAITVNDGALSVISAAPQLATALLNQASDVQQEALLIVAEAYLIRVGVNAANAPG